MKDGNYMKNKNGENENKIKFRVFNFIMDKMDRYGGKKHKDIIDAVPVIPTF